MDHSTISWAKTTQSSCDEVEMPIKNPWAAGRVPAVMSLSFQNPPQPGLFNDPKVPTRLWLGSLLSEQTMQSFNQPSKNRKTCLVLRATCLINSRSSYWRSPARTHCPNSTSNNRLWWKLYSTEKENPFKVNKIHYSNAETRYNFSIRLSFYSEHAAHFFAQRSIARCPRLNLKFFAELFFSVSFCRVILFPFNRKDKTLCNE